MPFQKGNKLAKGGKRDGAGRKPSEVNAAREALDAKHGPAAYERLVRIAENDKHPEQFKANALLVAYWRGKPAEKTDVNVGGGITVRVKWTGLPDAGPEQ